MIKNRKMKLSESWKSLWWYDNMQRKQLNGNVIWETTRACRNILMIVNWGFPNGFQAMDMTILLRNAYLPLPGHYTRKRMDNCLKDFLRGVLPFHPK